MKSLLGSFMAMTLAVFIAGPAYGRNVQLMVPIVDAMAETNVSDRPSGAVKFFVAKQKAPEIVNNFGSYFAAPRTGAAGRSDQRACHEAFLWTLVHLEKRAQRVGANAVVNIVSYYQKKEIASASEFECHVGNVIVTVWLKGDLVKVGE